MARDQTSPPTTPSVQRKPHSAPPGSTILARPQYGRRWTRNTGSAAQDAERAEKDWRRSARS
jgi:hypothetical protein